MFRLLGLQFSWLERLPNRLYIFIVVHCNIMRNLKELTNEELIKTYKEHKCSLKSIEKDFGLGKNAAGRLFNKRNIDYNKIKEEEKSREFKEYNKHPKVCKQCGNPIPFESRNKKEFCSLSCAATYNNIKRYKENKTIHLTSETKAFCLNCGKELFGEQRRNKYCSVNCQQEFQHKQYINNWKQGLESGTTGKYGVSLHIRKYLFDKYNNSCQLCGWNKVNPYSHKIPLQIHHIDGNCLNNKEENLQLLCPNCHSLTETFGSLNKESSRIYRKQKENI